MDPAETAELTATLYLTWENGGSVVGNAHKMSLVAAVTALLLTACGASSSAPASGESGSQAPEASTNLTDELLAARSGNLRGAFNKSSGTTWKVITRNEDTLDAAAAQKQFESLNSWAEGAPPDCGQKATAAAGEVPVGSTMATNAYGTTSGDGQTIDVTVTAYTGADRLVTMLADNPSCLQATGATQSSIEGFPTAVLNLDCAAASSSARYCGIAVAGINGTLVAISGQLEADEATGEATLLAGIQRIVAGT